MNTVEVKSKVALNSTGRRVIIEAHIGFDSAMGLFVSDWSIYTFIPSKILKNEFTYSVLDLNKVSFEEFQEIAQELQELTDKAIANEAMYADMESMHLDRFNQKKSNY